MIQSLAKLFLNGPSRSFVEAAEKALNSHLPTSPKAVSLSLIIGDSLRCLNDLQTALDYYHRAALQKSPMAEIRIEALERFIILSKRVLDISKRDIAALARLPPRLDESRYLPFPSFDDLPLKERFLLLESVKVELLCKGTQYKTQTILPCLKKVRAILSREKNLQQYVMENRRTFIIGDIHGSTPDLLSFYELCMLKEVQVQSFQSVDDKDPGSFTMDLSSLFIFLGDYVDRGPRGLECVLFLCLLKYLYPRNVILLRGNHECDSLNQVYGFTKEVFSHYGSKGALYEEVQEIFAAMPCFCRLTYIPTSIYEALNAALPASASPARRVSQNTRLTSLITQLYEDTHASVSNSTENIVHLRRLVEETAITVFCCHGGPPCIYTECSREGEPYLGINNYENILQRSLVIVDPLISELTWNDPSPTPLTDKLYDPSPRRLGYKYSYDLFRQWCANTGINILFRGHEVAFQGVRQDFQYAFDPKQLGGPNNELEYWFSRSSMCDTPRHFTVFSSSMYEDMTNHGSVAILQYTPPTEGVEPLLAVRCLLLS